MAFLQLKAMAKMGEVIGCGDLAALMLLVRRIKLETDLDVRQEKPGNGLPVFEGGTMDFHGVAVAAVLREEFLGAWLVTGTDRGSVLRTEAG